MAQIQNTIIPKVDARYQSCSNPRAEKQASRTLLSEGMCLRWLVREVALVQWVLLGPPICHIHGRCRIMIKRKRQKAQPFIDHNISTTSLFHPCQIISKDKIYIYLFCELTCCLFGEKLHIKNYLLLKILLVMGNCKSYS